MNDNILRFRKTKMKEKHRSNSANVHLLAKNGRTWGEGERTSLVQVGVYWTWTGKVEREIKHFAFHSVHDYVPSVTLFSYIHKSQSFSLFVQFIGFTAIPLWARPFDRFTHQLDLSRSISVYGSIRIRSRSCFFFSLSNVLMSKKVTTVSSPCIIWPTDTSERRSVYYLTLEEQTGYIPIVPFLCYLYLSVILQVDYNFVFSSEIQLLGLSLYWCHVFRT